MQKNNINKEYVTKNKSIVFCGEIPNNYINDLGIDENTSKVITNKYNDLIESDKYEFEYIICDVKQVINISSYILERCIIYISGREVINNVNVENYMKYNNSFSRCKNIICDNTEVIKYIRSIFPINTKKIISIKDVKLIVNNESSKIKDFEKIIRMKDFEYLNNERKRLEELFEITECTNMINCRLEEDIDLNLSTHIERIIEIYRELPNIIESRRYK